MRVFIIDTANLGPELRGGLIGVVGSASPPAEEKKATVETVSRYAMDGWAIAADPHTPIGHLAAVTAETACSLAAVGGQVGPPPVPVRGPELS